MRHPTRRLAAVWFADVAGFTKLSATDEPLALLVMDAMRDSVRASVAAQHGTLIKFMGDGALAEFPSAEGAVEAALEASARFKGATRPLDGGPYKLHVGIHVGDVAVASDGDIFGDGVNRAARLQSLAEPGQILVSEDVVRSVRRGLEFQFNSMGERTAKGLDEPFEVFEIEARGAVLGRLGLLERQAPPAPPQPVAVATSLARHPRAVATGIAAGLVAFIGLGVWTAMGGTSEGAIPDVLPLPASDMRLPPWPEPSVVETAPVAAAPAVVSTLSSLTAAGDAGTDTGTDAAEPTPAEPAASSLGGMAQRANAILRNRDLSAHETLPLLRTAADAAEMGTGSDAQAHAVRGMLQFVVARDSDAAEKAFQASLASDPQSGAVRRMYAQLLTTQARYQEALFQLEQAKGQGLSSAALDAARGAVLFRQGLYREAEGALDRALDRNEDALSIRLLLARAKIQRGEERDAVDLLNEATGSVVWPWVAYAQLHEKQGDLTPADLDQFMEAAGREDAGLVGALLYVEMGQVDRALEVIDRQLAAKDPDLLWLSVDPEWAALRANPQFTRRVVRVFER